MGKFASYYQPEQLYSKSLLFFRGGCAGEKWKSTWRCQIGPSNKHAQGIVLFDWRDRAEEFMASRDELRDHSIETVSDDDDIKQFFRIQMRQGAEYFFINPDPNDCPLEWENRRSIADALSRLSGRLQAAC